MSTSEIELFSEQEVSAEDIDLTINSPQINSPWDPNSVKVNTKQFSLRNVIDLINEGSLDIAPEFQRSTVWNYKQKTELIESILLQIPMPAFYFAEDKDSKMIVIDGVQRLSTILEFVKEGIERNPFVLKNLRYLSDINGQTFSDLPLLWTRRFHNTQIVAHVLAPSTPIDIMFDVFKRINTNGTPLNAQEIRHGVSKSRTRNFLTRLVNLPSFNQATSGLLNHKRMIDREVALRFVAFFVFGYDGYVKDNKTMEGFLLEAIENIDNPNTISEEKLNFIAESFNRGLINAYEIFGKLSFRKLAENSKGQFNRALFESWAVELAKIPRKLNLEERNSILNYTREEMSTNSEYIDSISQATSDSKNVKKRFETASKIINKVVK